MNAQVDAYDNWLKQKGVDETYDATTLGAPKSSNEFLANRLCHAFRAGFIAGEHAEKDRIIKRIGELLA